MLFNNVPHRILGILSFDILAKITYLSRHYFNEEYRVINDTGYNLGQRQYRTETL